MRVKNVIIKNFRSIKHIDLNWDPDCLVLVGINESGKTNILRAISMLSDQYVPDVNDEREVMPDEAPVEESYVRFIYPFDGEAYKELDKCMSLIVGSPSCGKVVTTIDGKNHTLLDVCRMHKGGLYEVDIISQSKSHKYWSMPNSHKNYDVNTNWKKPSALWPAAYTVAKSKQPEEVASNQSELIYLGDFDSGAIADAYLEDVDFKYLWDVIGIKIVKLIADDHPDCRVWQYSDDNLMPGAIPLAAFTADPNSCLPLRHMFELSGFEGTTSIQQALSKAGEKKNGMSNLLKRVARITTEHIRAVWKDYKNIQVSLAENGSNIVANIQDEFNAYDFSRRSDGFKRFITFLLMISAKERVGTLENAVLIIDEPDIGMHPSGARHLRDELIEISSSNLVIFSTHSIFMIDRENVDRHLIVTKKKEETTIARVEQSNIVDEEVIYNALGYSVFESLNERNIVFEGWRDKRLFKVALNKRGLTAEVKGLKKVGCCHAKGVKDVGRITPLIELANRACWIIADNDPPSLEQQKKYEGYGEWLVYSNLIPSTQAKTGEDFVKADAIKKVADSIARVQHGWVKIELSDLSISAGKIEWLKQWLRSNNCPQDEVAGFLNQVKEHLFNNLKSPQIEDEYFDLLEALAIKIG
ncbi:hypothetical protein D8Y20_10270 [Mariprofundus sp. EBB-1]|uniref:AAA family ATPase n=1 Tax=Mariprofundus sp. EBB-1 TaxID=2650971 RepID=UPI000EF21B24|nr:AAA family ATPase [Mariprofundus sp. EBB-1]RLL50987.1 hypothetical protein D8Y20_10270 [Mariprofundus sp. EBB-1]